MQKGTKWIIALLAVLIICVIAALAVLMLDMYGIIGNDGKETQKSDTTQTLLIPDSDTSASGDTQNNENTGAITAPPSAETTADQNVETTARPMPETTSNAVPETTAKPAPETTAKPAPETTTKPTPDTTAQQTHTHSWSSWKTLKEATCTEVGNQERSCACGEKETRVVRIGHTYSYVTTKESTCTEEGVMIEKCRKCGYINPTTTKSIEKKSHSYSSTKVDATCTLDGYLILTCIYCETSMVQPSLFPALGHQEGKWVIEKEATLSQSGLKTLSCTVCKEILKTEITYFRTSEGLNYRLNDDGEGYTVIGIGSCTDNDIVIPNVYNGLPVTIIGDSAFKYSSSHKLNSVFIPDSIITIEDSAFLNQKLTKIVWGNSVQTIEDSAFYGCTYLTSLSIPDSVIHIKEEAFAKCSKLTDLTLGKRIESIGKSAFSKCSQLTNLAIPNSVKTIGASAFSGCEKLVKVSFGKSIVSVGSEAFDDCSNLTGVYVDSIESWCKIDFEGSGGVYYNPTPTEFTSNPLYYAHHLYLMSGERVVSINVPKSVTRIGQAAFAYSTIKSVTLHNAFSTIEDYAFWGCSQLQSVDLDTNISHIGYRAFVECSALKEIVIPNSVTYLGYDTISENGEYFSPDKRIVFDGCSALSKVEFGTGIQRLGSYFSACDNLSTIVIPEGVTEIHYLFSGTNVQTTTIPNTIINIDGMHDCEVKNVIIQDGLKNIGYGWFSLSKIESIKIPSSVTTINEDAFQSCNNLLIEIPASVKYIEKYAFGYCDNLKVYLQNPQNLIISDLAFDYCINSQLHIPDIASWCNSVRYSSEYITSYPEDIVLYCDNKPLVTVTVPEGVTSIPYGAFHDQDTIVSIYLPKSLKQIGDIALSGCNNLDNVYFAGTKSEWKKISLVYSWDRSSPFKVIHCSDGDIQA